tara:strand:+ start:374 stop:1357 length:984 start_codon:yes stop_codon:yes gene_type:complete
MAICGLNVSLDSVQGDITAKISGFISLDDALEAPELLSSYKSTLLAGMASMKANVSTMIPDIPISSSGFTSLRDQMSAYVSLPSVAGLADITSKFGGLTSLTGYANINLSDLASSAFSLGASFDPCALAGDLKIPNITADATGALDALTAEAPNIGGTVMSLKRQIPDSKVFDSLALAAKDNMAVMTTTTVPAAMKAFNTNVLPSVQDAIQTLPSGDQVIRTVERHTEEIKAEALLLYDEDAFGDALKTAQENQAEFVETALTKTAKTDALIGKASSASLNKVQMYRMLDDGSFDDPSSENYHKVDGVKMKLVEMGSEGQFAGWVEA